MITQNQYRMDERSERLLTLQYGQFILDNKKVPSLDIIRSSCITNLFLKKCYNNALENLKVIVDEYPSFEKFHKQNTIDYKKINQLFKEGRPTEAHGQFEPEFIEYFELMELKKIKEVNEKFYQLSMEINELNAKENPYYMKRETSITEDEEKIFRYLFKKEQSIEANKAIDDFSSCVIS